MPADSFDTELRDKFELDAHNWTAMVYDLLQRKYNVSIEAITPSTDEYSSYDITAEIRGEKRFIENKTRTDKYHWDDKKMVDEGYYLASAKNDGQNSIFNYWFPQDNIVMITNDKELEDLTPVSTKVDHIKACDPTSRKGLVSNYIVPQDRWWIYRYTDTSIELVSKPKYIVK